MTSKPSLYLTVSVEDSPRAFLSIKERNGETYLVLRHAEKFLEEPQAVPSGDITEQRYSIHQSPNLADKNVISQTLVVDGEKHKPTQIHTEAIKSGKGFCHIFSRASCDLSNERYLVPPKAEDIEIVTSYQPSYFTFLYSVYVGSNEAKFKLAAPGNIRTWKKHLTNVQLVILYSFCPFVSHGSAFLAHSITFKPELVADNVDLSTTTRGLNPRECLALSQTQMDELMYQYMSHTAGILDPEAYQWSVEEMLPIRLAEGHVKSKPFLRLKRKLSGRHRS